MRRGKPNPVKNIFQKHNIVFRSAKDVKKLSCVIKFEIAVAWMWYEHRRGAGVIRTGGGRDTTFMSGIVLPAFESLVDKYDALAEAHPTDLRAKYLVFINEAIGFGERLALTYFKSIKKSKDNDSGL